MATRAPLRIYLLGAIRAEHDGRSCKIATPPRLPLLLAYLLLHRRLPIPRDVVAFTLWTDESESVARSNLRRHLNYLKRALPQAPDEPWIIADTHAVQWNTDSHYWLDVAEFEAAGARGQCADAVELYGADLLHGYEDEWIHPERERLRNLYADDLMHLIAQERSLRRYAAALAYAGRLVAFDPWREETVRQIMALRFAAGDRLGALQEYRQLEQRLRDDIGVEPSAETFACFEAVSRNEAPAVRFTEAIPRDEPVVSRALLPFVGRDAEIAELDAWWQRAANGHGAVVFVAGEAGIGKTRLAREEAEIVARQGGNVIVGATGNPQSIPFQCVIEALRYAIRQIPAFRIATYARTSLRELLPELADPQRAGPARVAYEASMEDLRAQRDRIFESLALAFSSLAATSPLFMLLEDLHWANADTLDLIGYLAHRLHDMPVLIVLTYREEEIARDHPLRSLRRGLARSGFGGHIALGAIGEPAIARLASDLFAIKNTAQATEFVQRLLRESEGSPFFINEIISDNLESGELRHETEGWAFDRLTARLTTSAGALTQTRLARLSSDGQTLAELAAVVGRTLNVEILREMSGWPEARVLNALGELLDRHIVREATAAEPRGYAFSHQLVQAAAYARLDDDTRRRRHRRAGQVIESLYADTQELVAAEAALHFDRGGDTERAAAFYLRAATQALAASGNDAALEQSERGLALVTDPAVRGQLLFAHEEAARRCGNPAMQRRDLDELRSSSSVAADDKTACELHRRCYYFSRAVGDDKAAAESLRELGRRAHASLNGSLRAISFSVAGHSALHNANLPTAGKYLERARTLFERAGDVAGQIECLALLAECISFSEQEQSVGVFNRARELATLQHDPMLLSRVSRAAAVVAWMQDGSAALEAVAEPWRALAESMGDRSSEAWATFCLGIAARLRFDVAPARQYQQSAWATFESLGDPTGLCSVQLELAELETYAGRPLEALRLADLAVENCRRSHYQRGFVAHAIVVASIANCRRDFTAAFESAGRALAMDVCKHQTRYRWLALNELAQAELGLGHTSAAVVHAEENLARTRRFGPRPDVIADALCSAARAHAGSGDRAKARAEADELVELLSATEREQPRRQLYFWLMAQTYRSIGCPDESRRAGASAFEHYERLLSSLLDADAREAFAGLWFNREIVQEHLAARQT